MTSHLSDADRAELGHVWSELAAAQRIIERLLGDDDPTGLTYSRDDDEPVAAPTRPHYGFSLTGRNQRPTSSPTGPAPDIRRAAHSSSDGPVGARTSPLAFGVGAAGDLQGAAGWDGPAAPARGCAW